MYRIPYHIMKIPVMIHIYVIRTGGSVRCHVFCIIHGVCIDDADPSPYGEYRALWLLWRPFDVAERNDDVIDAAHVPNVDVGGRRKDPMGKSCGRRFLLYCSYDSWN